jgi:hypothetical protein
MTASSTPAVPRTRAERFALPVAAEVIEAIAAEHGVCARPVPRRRIDLDTGRVEVLPISCNHTRETSARPAPSATAAPASRSAGRAGTSSTSPT